MTGRILVAGIGNIFLGDDGFGVELARQLAERQMPPEAEVRDFGVRGMDLAYTLLEDYREVIFVDAASRGERPGTVSLIEHETGQVNETALETHAMDPVKVLNLASALGAPARRVFIVACEPESLGTGDEADVSVGLSRTVEAAVDEATKLVETLVAALTSQSVVRR